MLLDWHPHECWLEWSARAAVVTLGLLAGHAVLVPTAAADACLTVRVTNCVSRTVRVASGPVTLCADVRLKPDVNHRLLRVAWDYAERLFPHMPDIADDPELGAFMPHMGALDPEQRDGVVGTSERSISGDQGPPLERIKLAGLSGGTYEVVASVYTDSRARHLCSRARTEVIVQ